MNRELTRQTERRAAPAGFTWTALLLLAALTIGFGCAGGTDIGNPEGGNFSSSAALKDYITDQYAQSALPENLKTEIADSVTQPVVIEDPQYSDLKNFSDVVAPEPGAEKADKVQTDGRYLYVAGSSAVRIVDTDPTAGLREAAWVPVNGTVDALYLYGSSLIILYTPADGTGDFWAGRDETTAPTGIGLPEWLPVNSRIGILLVDVTDPEQPLVRENFQADGNLAASRLVNGRLHVVIRFLPDLPSLDLWHDGTAAGAQQTATANHRSLKGITLDDLVPAFTLCEGDGQVLRQGRLVDAKHFLKPELSNGGSITAVITLDPAGSLQNFTSVGLVADVHYIYASREALYLISTRYSGATDKEGADGDALFQSVIHQMDLSGERVVVSATGDVPGRMISPRAVGESKGVLRLATVTGNAWDGTQQNHLFCLEQQQNTLTVIGRLDGLLPGETMYAAWFMGDRGYLATLANTDSVRVLNLADPAKPSVAGKLSFSGHATLVYPLDARRLLVMGKEVVAEGDALWYQGIRMALFDVNDADGPKLIDSQTIGDRGTESEALYNPRAVAFHPEGGWLALPVDLSEHQTPPVSPSDFGLPVFYGLYVYRLTPDNTLERVGQIPMEGEAGWMRSLFVQNRIVAVSAEGLSAAGLPELLEPFDNLVLAE